MSGGPESGRHCSNFVLKKGRELGARRATLEVRRSNEVARLLYERFGFSVAGVRPAYYTKPVEDALILWREDATAERRP
jgi:ribosomal-protein-alanine N-acetyltransferase